MPTSLTLGGLLIAVVGPMIVTFGISDSCSNELTTKGAEFAPILLGAVTAWIGRVRAGGVTWYGSRTV